MHGLVEATKSGLIVGTTGKTQIKAVLDDKVTALFY